MIRFCNRQVDKKEISISIFFSFDRICNKRFIFVVSIYFQQICYWSLRLNFYVKVFVFPLMPWGRRQKNKKNFLSLKDIWHLTKKKKKDVRAYGIVTIGCYKHKADCLISKCKLLVGWNGFDLCQKKVPLKSNPKLLSVHKSEWLLNAMNRQRNVYTNESKIEVNVYSCATLPELCLESGHHWFRNRVNIVLSIIFRSSLLFVRVVIGCQSFFFVTQSSK